MKLLLILLSTLINCAPERKKRQAPKYDRVPKVSCTDAGATVTSVEMVNNLSGRVTVKDFNSNMHCYVNLGPSCSCPKCSLAENLALNTLKLDVEISYMTIETEWTYDYYDGDMDGDIYESIYRGCYDTVHFAWFSNGDLKQTEGQCGCLGDENHPTCSEETTETQMPTKYQLEGTDTKLIITTDSGGEEGIVTVDWKLVDENWRCPSPLPLTTKTTPLEIASNPVRVNNILEMAKTMLTGDFKYSMARDYGCSGRGLFDPFEKTIGSHIDEIDAAFFSWKKCIQCASGRNSSNVEAYFYNTVTDACCKWKT